MPSSANGSDHVGSACTPDIDIADGTYRRVGFIGPASSDEQCEHRPNPVSVGENEADRQLRGMAGKGRGTTTSDVSRAVGDRSRHPHSLPATPTAAATTASGGKSKLPRGPNNDVLAAPAGWHTHTLLKPPTAATTAASGGE